MARGKYHENVLPHIEEIPLWRRAGLTENQIAAKVGVAYSTFRKYRDEHPALSAALKKGKENLILELEESLYKKALGYEYQEEEELAEVRDGKVTVKRKKILKKYAHPDTGALAFALKNLSSERWQDRHPVKDNADATEQDARIAKLVADTARIIEETARKSGVKGAEVAEKQAQAIADMINSPEAERALEDYLGADE